MRQNWNAQSDGQNNCSLQPRSDDIDGEKASSSEESKVNVSKDLAAAAGFNVETPIVSAIIGNIMGTIPTKKTDTNEILRCKICDCEVSSNTILELHINGSKHRKKLRALDIIAHLKQEKGVLVGNKDNPNAFQCEVCCVTVNSAQQLEFHLSGAKHKKKAIALEAGEITIGRDNFNSEFNGPPPPKKKRKEEIVLECDVCNVFLNSQIQYDQHLTSRKHKLKLSAKEQSLRKFKSANNFNRFPKNRYRSFQQCNFQQNNNLQAKFKRQFTPNFYTVNNCF